MESKILTLFAQQYNLDKTEKLLKHILKIGSDAKIGSYQNQTNSDISQEESKWWSSPQQPFIKNNTTSNEYLPPRPRRDSTSLTPKVTESPAPQIQVQKLNCKHHLDDSEIKRTLWDQNQERNNQRNTDQILIEKRLFAPIFAPIEQSVCSSQYQIINAMETKILTLFAQQYNLDKTQKLLKHILTIGTQNFYILMHSDAKLIGHQNQPNSDVFSQEQLKWCSSPQQPLIKNRSVDRDFTQTSNQYLPPRPRRDSISLTQKVTESPAPQIQVQKLNYKHHLDDSEIKRTLWDQNQERNNQRNTDQILIEKRLFAPVLAPIEQSVCSSQQSFHEQEQQRQGSPRFKINEISLTEQHPQQKPQLQKPKKQKRSLKEKENHRPQIRQAQGSAQKSQYSFHQQVSKVRNSIPRKTQKSEHYPSIQYKNVKSKIKEQIEYDRTTHRLNRINQYTDQTQNNETLQSQQTLYTTTSDDQSDAPQVKQQTYTTFQMNNSNQDNNHMISNRNPMISVNTRAQFTTNATGPLEDVFQYTMNRPSQLENNNDTAHVRYISSITSHNSAEATPVNQKKDIYSQAQTAQSVYLQSAFSNKNDKRTSSSGNCKSRFKSDMRSDDLIERDELPKLTSDRRHISQQFSGASNHMLELASQYYNRQSDRNKDPNDGSQFQSQDDQFMDKRLREILAHHDYHSSISSNFSLFNPKDELKTFFQKEFIDRQVQEPSQRKFLTSRIPQKNEDNNSSNVSFNNGSDQVNKERHYDL